MIRVFFQLCKTFHSINKANLSDLELLDLLESVSTDSFHCPSCSYPSESFQKNGSYFRHLISFEDGTVTDRLVCIKNVMCPSCNHSHALIASHIIPYSQFSLYFIITLFYYRLTRKASTIDALCQMFDISIRTYYRLKRRFFHDAHTMRSFINKLCSVSELIETMFGFNTSKLLGAVSDFFYSTGYSFMQPLIELRLTFSSSCIPPGSFN